MKTTLIVTALLGSMVFPGFARAQENPPVIQQDSAFAPEEPPVVFEAPPRRVKRDRGEVMLAIKGGGLFSEPFSELGPSYLVDVELGYALPVLKHRLALAVDVGYTNPQANGKETDPRITAGASSYSWHLEQRELLVGLTFYYRHPIGRLVPYIGVGPRLFLLESRVKGNAGGEPISLSTEQSTKIGAHVPVGLGVTVGPGHLFIEGALLIGNIDHTTTGNLDVGVSSLTLTAGYRFML
jgi:hypothetical protein